MTRPVETQLRARREPFQERRPARAKSPSTALRKQVAAALGGEPDIPSPGTAQVREAFAPGRKLSATDMAQKRCCGLRLSLEEIRRLRAQSTAAGMWPSHYVAALLLSVEAGRTTIAGKDALRALIESNDELVWIGRRLNQLAQQSTRCAGAPMPEPENHKLLEAIEQLHRHLEKAASVLTHVEITRRRHASERRRSWYPAKDRR
jgi:hypothetical protein